LAKNSQREGVARLAAVELALNGQAHRLLVDVAQDEDRLAGAAQGRQRLRDPVGWRGVDEALQDDVPLGQLHPARHVGQAVEQPRCRGQLVRLVRRQSKGDRAPPADRRPWEGQGAVVPGRAGGGRHPPRASSTRRASSSATSSRQGRATTWTPMGRPSGDVPARRTTTLGQPVRL
jgi:hypothetical protein